MIKTEIPTPALLLDLDRFERNIAKMAAHVKAVGKKLRPHSKTHKCPEIARRQIAAGAVGICCAKVGEAEVMAASGIRNMLITTEVVGPEKIGRLLGVLEQAPETLVVVDNPDNVRELGQAMARAGKVLNVLVDVDVGGRRTGTQPGEPAVHVARMVTLETALTVLTTVVSVPTREMAMVDGGLKAFSTDKPFVPEAVECPGVTYSWAGDEHGRLMVSEEGRLPALGQLIEFFPPHCDPTINLYDRIYAMRGQKVEAIWDVAGRGRSQ